MPVYLFNSCICLVVEKTMGLVEALYLAAKSFTNNMGLVEALYLVTNLRVSCFILCLLSNEWFGAIIFSGILFGRLSS